MNKHTPGPWSINNQYAETEIRGPQDSGTTIAVMSPWGVLADEPSQQRANARLIAAAPDLLLALREIADDYADRFDMSSPSTNPGIKYVVKQARAAIAKATGEGA